MMHLLPGRASLISNAFLVPNRWPSDACAKAFWAQQDCPPYQRLLEDTLDWAVPGPDERWLDLGCGGGAITRAIWERTNGLVGTVIGLDCAVANEHAYRRLRETLSPAPTDRIQFIHHDFSSELGPSPGCLSLMQSPTTKPRGSGPRRATTDCWPKSCG
jgi:hypothetical protein